MILEQGIIILGFFFIYFNISGLSTTNILRLTSGNDLPVLASKCVCGNCGAPITPFYQLPIISYILCTGRCRNCKVKIPVDALVLEFTVLIGMFLISALSSFSFYGVTFSFIFYEVVRIVMVAVNGRRNRKFAKQYFIAVFAMLPYYLITLFVAFIYMAVCV